VAPFGSLLAGALADRIGVTYTLLAGGLVCIVGAAVFASKLRMLRDHIIPVYRKKGILPEVAAGIQSATELTAPPED